jgi:hypothetical protein
MRRGEVVLRTNWRTVRHIYIPLGQPNHFVAVVINVKDRSISYIDTISGSRSQQGEHAAIWNEFVATYLCDIFKCNFSITELEYPKQRDGTSCGVLVGLFGRNIATQKTLMSVRIDNESMLNARQEILRTLEDNKDTERCCACRQQNDTIVHQSCDTPLLLCSIYSNKFQFGCAMKQYHASEDEMKLFIFTCSYCTM